MTPENRLRRHVRALFPHVKLTIRTVSFADFARDSAKFVTIAGAKSISELAAIEMLVRGEGMIPRT